MSEQPSAEHGSGGQVVLGGRYQIRLDRPLPELDSPMAAAFAATDNRATGRSMFALVCRPDLLPRVDIIPQLSRISRLPILSPVDAGATAWPEAGGRRFVILFEQAMGERVLPSPEATIEPLREDDLVRTVIRPLLPALKELSGRNISHRALRADNLFYANASRQAVVLGECVSAPPGLSQPVLYEPIESAMAMPSGRGLGTPADDLYALGVMLVVLLGGGNPVAGKSDDEIIEAKISGGSYFALLGQLRVTLSLMEPLRGLLCDDPEERWTVSDLEMWLGGRQLSPKQPMLRPKAARAMTFAGKEYWTGASLSFAMGRHWSEAGRIVTSGELAGWIRRSLSDDDTAEAIAVVAGSTGGGSDTEELQVSRALMAFDPTLPIRYKDFSARIDGMVQALAINFHDQEMRKTFVGLMTAKLPQTFLQSQTRTRAEHAPLMKMFDMINHFMERPRLGSGLERALYQCNRGWPCQSPLIRDEYVSEIADLLPALEQVALRGAIEQEPVDGHIVAFCAARIDKLSERILKDLNTPNDLPTFRLGVLHLLAEVQRAGGGKKYPALGQWVARLIEPIIETYHNLAYRQKLAEELDRARANGDLQELLFVIDNFDARSQDTNGFDQARKEHASHARGIAWLSNGGLTSPAHVQTKAQHAATIISAVISGLAIVGLAVIYVT